MRLCHWWTVLATQKEMLHHPQLLVQNALGRQLHSAPAHNAVLALLLGARVWTNKELIPSPSPCMHSVAYAAKIIVLSEHAHEVSQRVSCKNKGTRVASHAHWHMLKVDSHVVARCHILLIAAQTHVYL